MPDREGGAVVVGVDGFSGGDRALSWAVREASRRGVPLHIIHAATWPAYRVSESLGEVFRRAAADILSEAERRAHTLRPDLTVTTELSTFPPAPALLAVAEDAEMVVVGEPGRSRQGSGDESGGPKHTGTIMGSLVHPLVTYASCPVLVIRGEAQARPEHPFVVVGVESGEAGAEALRAAFEAADASGGSVVAVRAWHLPPPPTIAPRPAAADREALRQASAAVLEESVLPWREKYPQVPVSESLVESHPTSALLEAASQADLLVVGRRGCGGFPGLLLGSVGAAVAHQAACPVLLARRPTPVDQSAVA